MAKEMIETVKNYRACIKEKSNNAKANAIIIYTIALFVFHRRVFRFVGLKCLFFFLYGCHFFL